MKNIFNTLHHKIIYNKIVVYTNDLPFLAIAFIIVCMPLAVIVLLLRQFQFYVQTCKCYAIYYRFYD